MRPTAVGHRLEGSCCRHMMLHTGGATGVEQSVGRLVGALCVVTGKDDDAESAMLASWVSQVSNLHFTVPSMFKVIQSPSKIPLYPLTARVGCLMLSLQTQTAMLYCWLRGCLTGDLSAWCSSYFGCFVSKAFIQSNITL